MLKEKELVSVTVIAIVVKMLLTFPREIVINSGQAAWIQVLYVSVVAFLLLYLTTRIYKHKRNLIDLAYMTGGKILKIIIGVLLFLILLVNFSSVARIFQETVKIVLLQSTKIENIAVVFSITVAIGAYMGIGSIARVSAIFLPFAGIVFAGFILLLIPHYDLNNIMPVFGNGLNKIFLSGFNSLSLFSDIILLNILIPYCKNLDSVKRIMKKSVIISGALAVIITFIYCLTYVYPVSADYMIPVYQMARMVDISSFFSRFEAFFQFVWTILIFLYSSIYIFAMCYVLQQTFNLKYLKPLIFPVVIIGIAIAGVPAGIDGGLQMEKFVRTLCYPFVFLLPVIFGLITRKRGEKNEAL